MVKTIQRQVQALTTSNKKEWEQAIKDGKFIVGVKQRFQTYSTVITWYDNFFDKKCIEIKEYKTEASAMKLGKEIKAMIYDEYGIKMGYRDQEVFILEGVVSLLITIWIVTMILYSIIYVVLKYVFRIKVERFDWMLLLASLGVVLIRALFIWDELCLL